MVIIATIEASQVALVVKTLPANAGGTKNCSMQASLSFIISWSLLKLTSTELVMPSNHLVLCHPLLLLPSIFTSIRVGSSHQVVKVLEFQLQHQSFQLIFRTDFF